MMPYLQDDEVNAADAAIAREESEYSKEVNPPRNAAKSVANKLMSLADIAVEHARNNSPDGEITEGEEGKNEKEDAPMRRLDGDEQDGDNVYTQHRGPHPGPHFGVYRQHPAVAGPTRFGVMGHPAQFQRGPPVFGMYGRGGFRQGFPAHVTPVSPAMRHRGGFQMWARRPPFHTHHHLASQQGGMSPVPPAFRGSTPSPYTTGHQSPSTYDDDEESKGSTQQGVGIKRVSLDGTTKSILKKPRHQYSPPTFPPAVTADGETNGELEDTEDDLVPTRTSSPPRVVSAESTATEATSPVTEIQHKRSESTLETLQEADDKLAILSDAAAKKRIISPASSHDCTKSTGDDDDLTLGGGSTTGSLGFSPHRHRDIRMEGRSPTMLRRLPAGPFRMQPHPAMFGPHRRPPNRPFLQLPNLYHQRGMHPYAGGMPGAGERSWSPMMHPSRRGVSARGRAGLPPISPFAYTSGRFEPSAPSPTVFASQLWPQEHHPEACGSNAGADGNRGEAQDLSAPSPTPKLASAPSSHFESLTDVAVNTKRCVPLDPPVPSKYWSESNTTKDAVLPDFHRLVNYPDHLIKGRVLSVDGSCKGGASSPSALSGKKRCVMCGKLRISATYVRAKKGGAASSSPAPMDCNEEACSGGLRNDGSSHIIPRQNKGVCTACDVTVWVAKELDGLEIKWCKGCKNFRPWAAFGAKGTATKCVRCRERQKEKYALQKSVKQRTSATSSPENSIVEEDCSLALDAANGLRNLMNAQ